MLIAVVGPSGAGKDALIAAARTALAGDPEFVFPKREITRPAGGDEPFVSVDEASFEARRRVGAYAFSWRANGFGYGAPAAAARQALAGKRVVVNVSRAILPLIRARFGERRIILVEAARQTVAERLKARGRESEAEIADRLSRFDAGEVAGDDVVVVRNDGPFEEAVAAFIAALLA
jgi:ribose 1,5-bisphosphokinase